MAITLVVGIPGSGKTYEIVSHVIVPALEQGRRVVTNIQGLNTKTISSYLKKDITSQLILFEPEDPIVATPDFWYHPDKNKNSPVQPGDLVVIDEYGVHFPSGERFHADFLYYLRMHRHFVNDKGISSDVYFASQAFQDFHARLQKLAVATIHAEKLTYLFGIKTKQYRLRIYPGGKNPDLKSNTPLKISQKRYNPLFFTFYDSYKAPAGVEVGAGRTTNLFSNTLLSVFVPLSLAVISYSSYWLYSYFQRPLQDSEPQTQLTPSTSPVPVSQTQQSQTVSPPSASITSSSQYIGRYWVPSLSEYVYIFNVDSKLKYATNRDFTKVTDYGPFTTFELKDGTILSDVFRPQTPLKSGDSNEKNSSLNPLPR